MPWLSVPNRDSTSLCDRRTGTSSMGPENAGCVDSMPVSMTSITCSSPFCEVWFARVISREEPFFRSGLTASAPAAVDSPSTTSGLWWRSMKAVLTPSVFVMASREEAGALIAKPSKAWV